MPAKKDPLYNDIWEILKKRGKCKVAAHRALHKRIIHAVINKKYYDSVFKLELGLKHTEAKMYYDCDANSITFILTYRVAMRSLAAISLGDI